MLERLHSSLSSGSQETAFFIAGRAFSYLELRQSVAAFQHHLLELPGTVERLGIIANDDLETYAGILACLLSGITFVPIEPSHPVERNSSIIAQAGLEIIACSSPSDLPASFLDLHHSRLIDTGSLMSLSSELLLNVKNEETIAYILFTSGTTGVPKGVPISRKNLSSFLTSMFNEDPLIGPEDRFLQLFDLTFDLSVYSYLVPLIAGASVYTIPGSVMKYSYAIQLLQEHQITYVLSVPSFINFLRPYFKEIQLPSVKKWLFCGEALQAGMVSAWQKCVPSASIVNVYGPTESTIFCTSYTCEDSSDLKSFNGIVCIGKPFGQVKMAILEENNCETSPGNTAEICISGSQLTSGYLNHAENNREVFVEAVVKGQKGTWYRTGDHGFVDQEGDYFFAGRNDTQVKIQGYRVELSEIESQALVFKPVEEAIAVLHESKPGTTGLYLFVTPASVSVQELMIFLKERLPEYMIPRQVIPVPSFPLNVNGKIDRKALKTQII